MAPSRGLWWLLASEPGAASDQIEHRAQGQEGSPALWEGPRVQTAPPTLCSGTRGAAPHSPPFAGEFPVLEIS